MPLDTLKSIDDTVTIFPEEKAPLLHQYSKEQLGKKPYEGLRIFHNIPLTIETLFKVFCLHENGAEVTVSNCSIIPIDERCVSLLKNKGIEFVYNHQSLKGEQFDVVLDCCAEMLNIITPSLGAVELTQTGSIKYKKANTSYPVISVDDSKLKNLENCLGTGEAYRRAFKEFVSTDIEHKLFLIFGFGKVGRGVGFSLKEEGAHVTFVDPSGSARKRALEFSFDVINPFREEELVNALNASEVIVTATGVANLMSSHYGHLRSSFNNKILTNIGAEDEWGVNFTPNEVIGQKTPLNFLLKHATLMEFLDPIFFAHNYGINLLKNGKIKKGYNSLPQEFDDKVIEKWCAIHQYDKTKLFFQIT